MAADTPLTESDFPKRVTGRLGGFKSSDWQFAAFGLICTMAANHFFGRGIAVVLLVLFLIMLIPGDYGRLYGMAGQQVSIAWLKLRHKGVIWAGHRGRRLPQAEPIGLAVHAVDGLGLLHTAGNYDAVVIAAYGSNLASLELSGQQSAHAALSDIIRKMASVHEANRYNIGWGWVYRTRPLNVDRMNTEWGSYLHREAFLPSALEKPESHWTPTDKRWLAYGENIQQLLDVTPGYCREVTMAAVCTVPRQGFGPDLTEEDIRRLPIVQTARMLSAELAGNGVVDPAPLTPVRMHEYLRGGWDVKNIDDYYEWQLSSSEDEVLASDRHHPQEIIEAGDSYVCIDGSYTSVIWIKEFNGTIQPYRLRQLFDIEVPYLSVSLIGSTRSTGLEYAWIDRMAALSNDIDQIGGVIHKGPKAADRYENMLNRQRKIYESRYSQDFNILVAVHHISREGLEEAVDTALQQIRLANFEGQRVTGNIRQLPFALSAATGVDFAHM